MRLPHPPHRLPVVLFQQLEASSRARKLVASTYIYNEPLC